jgi:hypothetical protein
MNRLGHNSPPATPTAGPGGALSEANRIASPALNTIRNSARRKPQKTGRRGTDISIQPSTVFDDNAVRGLIDDWLVPALVKKFVADRLVQQSQEEK